MPVRVIITAGGELPRELRPVSTANVKALLRVGGRTLLEQAVAAVQASDSAGEIVVVGNDDVLRQRPAGVEYVEVGRTAVENLYRGFQQHGGGLEDEFLALSPDLPFVTGEAIDEFLSAARASSEMAFPVISADDFQRAYPGSTNRFERIDGARVTMGSCIYLTGRMLKTNIPLFKDFFNSRRAPHKLAALLGLSVTMSYLTGSLRIAQLEERARRISGGTVRAILVRNASLAFDIDKLVDYEYAVQRLNLG